MYLRVCLQSSGADPTFWVPSSFANLSLAAHPFVAESKAHSMVVPIQSGISMTEHSGADRATMVDMSTMVVADSYLLATNSR